MAMTGWVSLSWKQRFAALLELAHDVLQGRADHEVLLSETQDLADHRVVVGIQDVGDLGGVEVLVRLDLAAHLVERRKVECLHGLRLPEAQRVHDAVLIAENWHIVGHGAHRLIGKADEHRVALHAHAPGIAPFEPVIPFLVLEAVLEGLAEEPVAVADAVAVEGDVLACRGVQIARRKPPEAAVAEGGVLHLFKLIEVLAHTAERIPHFFENAEVQEVGINGAAHEKFGRKIAAAAAIGLLFFAPIGIGLLHDRLGNRIVAFFSSRRLQIAGIVGIEDALDVRKKGRLIESHDTLPVSRRKPTPWREYNISYEDCAGSYTRHADYFSIPPWQCQYVFPRRRARASEMFAIKKISTIFYKSPNRIDKLSRL